MVVVVVGGLEKFFFANESRPFDRYFPEPQLSAEPQTKTQDTWLSGAYKSLPS